MEKERNEGIKGLCHSGSRDLQVSKREREHGRLARRLAAEGMVLLKNEGLLPFAPSVSVALFGGGAGKTVKGGIGSGDVNNRESISLWQGLLEAGVAVTSEDWLKDYDRRYAAARLQWKEKILEDAKQVNNPFDAYAANPFVLPEGRRICTEDLKGAQAAIYVISRIAGEGKDRRKEEGDYYLSKKEREDLLFLDGQGLPVVLILNVGAPVELTDIIEETENIRGLLHICLPGQEGGRAVADVLLGRRAPGGRLTDTWARNYEDYPSAKSYGYLNGNLETEEYREGIYVGYRHFDSFGIEPLFPFGYGLSYTDFSVRLESLRAAERGVEVTVAVQNTGEMYEGREVVQVYVTPPQTGLAKEYQRLAGFAKTRTLSPGQEQILTIFLEQKQLASYSEKDSAWVMDAGKYGVWVGKHSACLELAAFLEVPERTVIEKVEEVCPLKADVQSREAALPAGGQSGETVLPAVGQSGEVALPAVGQPEEVVLPVGEQHRKWLRLGEEKGLVTVFYLPCAEERMPGERTAARTAALAGELPVEELIPLLYGNITDNESTLGSAGVRVPGSAGETTEALEEKYGIPSLIMADGPAGLRLRQSYQTDRQTDMVYGAGVLGSLENGFLEETVWHEDADTYYQYCTAFPAGTALAQAWDEKLMEEFGEAVAREMEEFHVNLWLAPGMNIHRNPLCGRNFEYYSEDPYLSGMLAAAVARGVQSRKGCGVTIKHFACNNQEDNRMSVDSLVSQRALREIYFRGFEIAVKKGEPAAIMTSYNRINGIHSANSYDLCTVLARREWGFAGVIMSDWGTTVPVGESIPWLCVEAGNDIIMPGTPYDGENILQAYREGKLSEEKIRGCAGRVLELAERLESCFYEQCQ